MNHGHVLHNDDYYAFELITEAPGFKEHVEKYFKYFSDIGHPIPSTGFQEQADYEMFNRIQEDNGHRNLWNHLYITFKDYTGNRRTLLSYLLFHLVLKGAPLPEIATYSIDIANDMADNSCIILKIYPGFRKEDLKDVWKHIKFMKKSIPIYNMGKNKERPVFVRNMKLYALYIQLCNKQKGFEKFTWEEKITIIQNHPDYLLIESQETDFLLNADHLRHAIDECALFFQKNKHLNSNLILGL